MSQADALQRLIALAADLQEGEGCGDALRGALDELLERLSPAPGPAPPRLGRLTVRRDGLPDWWGRANLLLAAPGAAPTLSAGFAMAERRGNLAVVGEGGEVGWLAFPGRDALTVIGDRVRMPQSGVGTLNGGATLIGEDCLAEEGWVRVDCRNGGRVRVGAQGLWSVGVNLLTDDMHTISDVASGRRVNGFGGCITVGRHVWLREDVRLVGGADVGEDGVVDLRSFVRDALAPASLSAGSPARPIRHGVAWTREDLP